MKLWLYLCAVSVCWGSSIGPPPARCEAGTLADYISLGSAGCSQRALSSIDVIFSDFGFSARGPLTAGDLFITPASADFETSLAVSADFSASRGRSISYVMFYTVDPPPIIHGSRLDMETLTPKNGGKARITMEICRGSAFKNPAETNRCDGALFTLRTFYDSSTSPDSFDLSDAVDFLPVDVIGVRITVRLDAGTGTSDISGFSTRTYLTVPEPDTAFLSVLGLGAVGLLRRRR